ncbi:MAG TPA: alanine racemase [Kiloniellaceae bacterium]|nr:alanine racemase [Kiloniellaceae bacterium]
MTEPRTTTDDTDKDPAPQADGDAAPAARLADVGHSGVLTVDLAAIVENHRRLHMTSKLRSAAAVVKADAYGLGAERVGPALARAGVRSFFVATLEEGLDLRAALDAAVPACSIYVLGGPLPGSEPLFEEHKLMPVINSLGQLETWRRYNKAREQVLPAALHVDTGLSRMGFPRQEVEKLAEYPALLDGTLPLLIVSHLVAAEEPAHPMNRLQLEAFRAALKLLPSTSASLANSSGIFLGDDYHFNMVRCGAALYGVNPTPGQPNPMTQVVQLKARILQTRWIDAPQSVGYGASHKVSRPTRIATVSAGYADGLFRSLSNRGKVWAAGREVPVVGRVSMDFLTIDITDLEPEAVGAGDFVEILGPNRDIDALAAEAGTIGYEMLTDLGKRYHRVYLQGDG